MAEEYIGPVCAILTAVAWAIGVIFFKQATRVWSSLALNYFKNLLALILFALTFPLVGEAFFIEAPFDHVVFLLVSGALGIGMADTLFFQCLTILGAARSAIVECLYSPSIVFFSFLLLGESLSLLDFAGGVCILSSILFSAGELGNAQGLDKRQLLKGLGFGAASMVIMGISIVAVKPILEVYPVLWSTSLRILGGVLVLTAWAPFTSEGLIPILKQCLPSRRWRWAFPGALIGSYLAMILWISGFKYGAASVTAILNQTSTIFTVLLAGLVLKETLTRQQILGTMAAFGGCILVLI